MALFTVCLSIYASLVAAEPFDYSCQRIDIAGLTDMTNMCRDIDKDPLRTCEARRVGALKWFITIRLLDLRQAPKTLPPQGVERVGA